ncbi:universal stress protein [Flavobacteriales bacterium]|nr:universal stress protein [Flavobacteriales bacterium]
METILIPTDFSANALKAAEYAICLYGKDVHYKLVNSYEVPHSGATMLISIADILEKDSLTLLEEERNRLIKIFPEIEERIEIKAKMGAPNVVVRKEAEDVDVVVMGTKGASGLKEVFVGSVASNVISDVKCPVIAVPEESKLSPPRKILFAADDKSLIKGELPTEFVDLANRFDAEVLVLNVVAKGEISHVGNNPETSRETIGVFENVKHSIHFIEDEDVNHGIETFIANTNVDMLAMITRKDDLFSRLFGTSNTKSMMMHSNVPLVAFH